MNLTYRIKEEKSYLSYLIKAYGPDKAAKMVNRPDISMRDISHLRKIVGAGDKMTISAKEKRKFKVEKEFDDDLK